MHEVRALSLLSYYSSLVYSWALSTNILQGCFIDKKQPVSNLNQTKQNNVRTVCIIPGMTHLLYHQAINS